MTDSGLLSSCINIKIQANTIWEFKTDACIPSNELVQTQLSDGKSTLGTRGPYSCVQRGQVVGESLPMGQSCPHISLCIKALWH